MCVGLFLGVVAGMFVTLASVWSGIKLGKVSYIGQRPRDG
jgi:hypothetical protein